MPEPYWPKKKGSYKLSDAAKNTDLARLRCRYCKAERFYLLTELKTAFGNVECDDVTYLNTWRCLRCKQKDTIEFDLPRLTPQDRQKVRLRRLDGIFYVRKVTWRDE